MRHRTRLRGGFVTTRNAGHAVRSAEVANPYPVCSGGPGLDLHSPRVGGMVNYLLGGDDHWEWDRDAARRVAGPCPEMPDLLRQNRRFRAHAIDYCVARGVHRFIDLGCGRPMRPMTHELIDGYTSLGRCAYVDVDVVEYAHTRQAVRTYGDPHRHSVLHADLRAAAHVLAAAHNAGTTTPGEPVALLFTNVLHHIADEIHEVLADYIRLVPPGSYFIVSHLTNRRMIPSASTTFARMFARTTTGYLAFATSLGLQKMLGGLDLVGPGVTSPTHWCRNCRQHNPAVTSDLAWLTAIARKPQDMPPPPASELSV